MWNTGVLHWGVFVPTSRSGCVRAAKTLRSMEEEMEWCFY
jgi:hypothetical protein